MANDLDFSDKRILITGAASGIGAACAAWLAGRGASRLVLVDRDEAALSRAPLDCETVPFTGDVSDPAVWERIEADVIRLAIGHYRGRMTEVARRLGIGRSTLYRKLSDLGIDNAA